MADIKEAIRRLIYEYVVEGADKVVAAGEAVTKSNENTGKAALSLDKSFGNLERRYVDTVRHQQDYAKVQEKVNAAVKQNPELQDRANVVLAAAAEHFNNLAANATKGSVASTLLSKAIGFVIGPAGLLGVAMTAVTFIAEKMWTEFTRGRTTAAQALAENERLMNQTKTAIGDLINANLKLQSTDQTRFEIMRNQIDLQEKLKKAMQEVAEYSERRATSPLQDIGAALGIKPVQDPGFARIAAEVETLKAAIASGQADIVVFNNEIARIGSEGSPEVQKFAQYVLGLAREATNLQVAAEKAGMALKSMAQTNLANLQMKEAADAAQRMAEATLQIAAQYPGMSVEVAKQLYSLDQQLFVAKARTGAEQLVAQEIATQNTLLAQGKTLEEAVAIAAKQREIAEAQIARTIEDQIYSLEQQTELIHARENGTEAAVKAEQAYQNAIRQGASAAQAERLKEATLTNALAAEQEKVTNQVQRTNLALNQTLSPLGNIITWTKGWLAGWKDINTEIGKATDMLTSQGGGTASGARFTLDPLNLKEQRESAERMYGAGNVEAVELYDSVHAGQNVYYEKKRSANLAQEIKDRINAKLETNKLNTSLEKLTDSTDSLNATMQNALSPYYSMDPRTTKLGFRAGTVGNPDWLTGAGNANPLDAILGPGATAPGMADGGSFVVGGGYSANDNKLAVFPVASGEEVVVNRNQQRGRGAQVINIDNRIVVNGSVDEDALSKMKVSRYQQAQRMRAGMAGA